MADEDKAITDCSRCAYLYNGIYCILWDYKLSEAELKMPCFYYC